MDTASGGGCPAVMRQGSGPDREIILAWPG
jgi:hypothetical protein